MQGVGRKLVLQGVRQVMGSDLGPGRAPGEPRRSRMLFIGIDLPRAIPDEGLTRALA